MLFQHSAKPYVIAHDARHAKKDAVRRVAVRQRDLGTPTVNTIAVAGHAVPLMLMSYLGARKGWLYVPVFAVWAPGPCSIRIPPVLMGAATVWLFFLLSPWRASPGHRRPST